jgi:membrane protein involved in colicin uptake
MWPMLQRNLKQQGWDMTVVHDPSEWLKAQEAEKQKSIEERMKAQAEAEAKKKAEEKAALKAEILAELKEQGIIPDTTKKTETKKGK